MSAVPTDGADATGAAAVVSLRHHPPFDEMEDDALRFLGSRLRVGYYPKDTPILAPAQGEPA